MKKILFSLIFTFVTGISIAQFPMGGGGFGGGGRGGNNQMPNMQQPQDDEPRGTGKIAGILMDSTTNKPVEFANVALWNKKTNKIVDGAMADDKGKFSLKGIAAGEYQLKINFLGMRAKTIDNIKVEKKGTDLNLGNIWMSPDVKMLKEVNVVGQAALIEDKVDRTVYNAEKDITNKGGDATDVLRKVPMLSVDLDGNVSLRGSQNVRVLINNKPSTIVASSVADALKQLPSDMIKSVEVITSPSAKYDAEGSAGIINIITKKNTLQGLTMTTDLSIGNRGANMGLNGNLRQGKMGFSMGGFGRLTYNTPGRFENTQVNLLNNLTTVQTANTQNYGLFGNYRLSWDYDIDKNNSLSAALRYGARNSRNTQDLITQIIKDGTSTPSARRDVESKDYSNTYDFNVDYTRKMEKPDQEFSLSTQYSRNNRTNNFIADLFGSTDVITGRQKNDNESYNQEITVQADYQTPLLKNQILEFGGKGIFRQVSSDFQYLFGQGATGELLPSPTQPGNTLNYDQNVTAGYFSFTHQTTSKWTFKVGSRYEYTFINANFTGDQKISIPNYGNLVPSINISKNLKGGRTIKWAYNRRLQRPSVQFLNPNINAANPQNISYGNPYLNPELTDNVEMSLSTFFKKVYLNASVFGRRTDNSITSVRTTDDKGVITTTYQNIGKEEAYGLNLFGNINVTSKWSVGGGADVTHLFLTNNSPTASLNTSNSGWVINYRFFTNLTLGNGWGLQGFGFMRSKQIQLQGSQGGFGIYSLGIKKDFKNKRGSLGLGTENFLAEAFKMKNEFTSSTFTQNSVNYMYNRGFRVSFNYRIGKMSFDENFSLFGKKKKSVNNDDQKKEDDGGQNQQQGGQGGMGGGRRGGR